MNETSATLTLDELEREVERRLRALGLLETQRDGRVSPAPDARTVRYYTTLGLVDRPRIVDREARYGRRHVLQLCAVKVLQAAGLPLAEVQSRLYGRSDAELEALLAPLVAAPPSRPAHARAEPRPICWRECTIEPGLKLVAEAGWSPHLDPATREERIRAALAALSAGKE